MRLDRDNNFFLKMLHNFIELTTISISKIFFTFPIIELMKLIEKLNMIFFLMIFITIFYVFFIKIQ